MRFSSTRTRHVSKPSVYFSTGIPLGARLQTINPDWQGHAWHPDADIGPAPHVMVLTTADAQAAIARGVSAPIILWAPQGQKHFAHASVTGALDAGSADDTVRASLSAALARSEEEGARAGRMLERVLEVGRALASEKDLDTLLGLILTHARALTNADGASIYTRDVQESPSVTCRDAQMPRAQDAQERPAGDRMSGAIDTGGTMYFRLWQNATTGDARDLQKTPAGEHSIAGYVARTGEALVIDDVYAIDPASPFQFNPGFDRASGYHTRSLLTLPLTNKAGEVVGVLQLINRKDDPQVRLTDQKMVDLHVRPFDAQDRHVASALAGQAGVALENSILYADIEKLFEGFIRASVQAIEARDPTTAGHSFRVADFSERLAIAVDRIDRAGLRDIRFSRDEMRELRYAALLHDFGKVGVREYVLVKAKKLQPHQLELVKHRFRYARASLERHALRELLMLNDRKMTAAEFAEARRKVESQLASRREELDRHMEFVLRVNEPTVTAREVSKELDAVAAFRFPGEDSEDLPLLEPFEFADLSLAKGSLNSEERAEIESHVTHTYRFLSLIPWTRNLANLPLYAYAHHEKLDGTGYPRRLPGGEIPVQSRMLTISDIYDALTAPDRPYKRGLPAEKALDILAKEAQSGKIDRPLYEVFVESRAWQPT